MKFASLDSQFCGDRDGVSVLSASPMLSPVPDTWRYLVNAYSLNELINEQQKTSALKKYKHFSFFVFLIYH